jgi:heme-degrading monooxygenase HmoA
MTCIRQVEHLQDGECMFIAMNRFKVLLGAEATFEDIWRNRDTHLPEVPGFIAFHLLRGPVKEDHVLYSSHTIWRDRTAFEDWTRSDAFRQAHRSAGDTRQRYLGHPELELFEVVQSIE